MANECQHQNPNTQDIIWMALIALCVAALAAAVLTDTLRAVTRG